MDDDISQDNEEYDLEKLVIHSRCNIANCRIHKDVGTLKHVLRRQLCQTSGICICGHGSCIFDCTSNSTII